MKNLLGLFLIALLALSVACGDDDNNGGSQDECPAGQTLNEVTGECEGGDDAGTQDTGAQDTGDDAGTSDAGGEDTGVQDTGGEDTGTDDTGSQDAAQGETGTLFGVVTRQASTEPEEDGVGNLYIAVFDRDPITNRDNAQLVGFQLIEDADVSADTAEVPYRIEDIPPRSEPYYVTAFLDDNGTADTSNPQQAGPDTGDLVAVESAFPPSSPQVTIDSATEVELDLVLKFNMI